MRLEDYLVRCRQKKLWNDHKEEGFCNGEATFFIENDLKEEMEALIVSQAGKIGIFLQFIPEINYLIFDLMVHQDDIEGLFMFNAVCQSLSDFIGRNDGVKVVYVSSFLESLLPLVPGEPKNL